MMDAPARTKARPRADHHPRWGVARRTGVRDDPQREQDDQVIQAVAEKTAGDGASRRNLSLRIHGWVAEGSSGRRRTVPRKGQDGRKRWGASTSTSWRASFPPSSRMNETFGIRSEERRGDRRFAFLEGGPIEGTPNRLLHFPSLRDISQPKVQEEGRDLRHDLTPVLTRDLRRRGQRDVVGEAWEDERPRGDGLATEVIVQTGASYRRI